MKFIDLTLSRQRMRFGDQKCQWQFQQLFVIQCGRMRFFRIVCANGDVRLAEELQFSVYNFEFADVDKLWTHFNLYEQEAQALLAQANTLLADEKASPGEKKRFPLLATYELALKCSHLFNLLDARGAISVTERVGVIGRIRNLAVGVAKAYALQQAAD